LGGIALIIFLCSLAIGILCLVVLVLAGKRIYSTLRYAYKDAQPWMELIAENGHRNQEAMKAMEERAQNITRIGQDMQDSMDDIRDSWDEIRTHPLIRTARFFGRLRRPQKVR
jgi:hypothetical protein